MGELPGGCRAARYHQECPNDFRTLSDTGLQDLRISAKFLQRRRSPIRPLICLFSAPYIGFSAIPNMHRALQEDLRQLHWDNCKVNFDRRLAYRYVLRALREGHNAASIIKCYERALQECHALATDRTASRGQICRFELSSTVRRAKRFLANNRLSKAERIRRAVEASTEVLQWL
jgi:hypothetical protein